MRALLLVLFAVAGCSGVQSVATPCRVECAKKAALCAVQSGRCFSACEPAQPAPAPAPVLPAKPDQ